MDLSKAFYTIPHPLLLAKLKAYCLSNSTSARYLLTQVTKSKSVLGPMFFNIFLNDLFYHINNVNLHAYAEDEQLYDSDLDPRALEQRILLQVRIVNQWYT